MKQMNHSNKVEQYLSNIIWIIDAIARQFEIGLSLFMKVKSIQQIEVIR